MTTISVLASCMMLLGFGGCVSLHGTHCEHNGRVVPSKDARFSNDFESTSYQWGGQNRTVLVEKGFLAHRSRPPVVILHEFPAVSAEVLDLAARIANQGYAVYVPVMLNCARTEPGNLLTIGSTFVHVKFGADWRATETAADRPVVDWLAHFCNERVARDHPRQRIGVVGMCLSGIFPIALLDKVPALAAPVVAHPSIPFHLLRSAAQRDRAATGLTSAAIANAKRIVAGKHLQILGLRFENDHFATFERFQTLRDEFGGAFCGLTLPASEYHCKDGLPVDAHSVLGGCYSPPSRENPRPATYRAYLEVLAFLDAKLRHADPRRYRASACLNS